MQYQDPTPENKEFVEEINRRSDFNNLYLHLPGQLYRESYAKAKRENIKPAYHEEDIPIWASIDEFIANSGFDVLRFIKDFDEGNEARERSQIYLCSLYVFLRKRGFTSRNLCA